MINKKKIIAVCLLILIFCQNIAVANAAGKELFYNIVTGKLEYNAVVSAATTSTKYKVIGFTVRFSTYETVIKLDQLPDIPNGDGTVTVPFRIPFVGNGNTIMQRFIDKYGKKDDFVKFFSCDNTIYLESIMTVVEDGTPLATMNYNGTFINRYGSTAKEGKDYFTTLSGIKYARQWKHPEDLNEYYELYCKFKGNPPPADTLTPPIAKISKGSTVISGTLSYMDDEPINLSGDQSYFPTYADGKYYKWEYKPTSSASWNTLDSGLGKVSPSFPKLTFGKYDVKLTVWYKVGSFEHPELNHSTQIILDIKQSPQGAYSTIELTCEPDKLVKDTQISANENISVKIDATGFLKNFTDITKISKCELFLRKDPAGTDSQYQTFTFTSGIGLSQSASKIFTVPAGLLKDTDKYTQKFVGRVVYTVNGINITSDLGQCAFTIYKGTAPPPPSGGNQPPVAVISGPSTVKVGEDVIISGAASYDPDGIVVDHYWGLEGTESKLEGAFGTITYDKEGEYNITLVVVDNGGAAGATQKTITVVPPTPVASFNVTGKLKEKRIVYLQNTSSSPAKFPILADKIIWSIKPVAGTGATDTIKKVVQTSTVKENLLVNPYVNGVFNATHSPVISFSQAGEYEITLSVQNTAGYTSTTMQRIKIAPDLQPVAKSKTDIKIYRESIINGVNYAKLLATDESYSPDGDFICYRKVYAVYDANNNGTFGDAADQTIVISESYDRNFIDSVKSFEYLSKDVGKYRIYIVVEESYIP